MNYFAHTIHCPLAAPSIMLRLLVSRSLSKMRAARAMHATPQQPTSPSLPSSQQSPSPPPPPPPSSLASEPVMMFDALQPDGEAHSGISTHDTDPGECKLPQRALEEVQLGVHVFTSYAESSIAVDAFSAAVTRRNTPAERSECLAKAKSVPPAPSPMQPAPPPSSSSSSDGADENTRA